MPTSMTRRPGIAAAAVLMTGALVLSGCSEGEAEAAADSPAETDADAASAEDSLLPPAEGKTEYPLTLETPYGETVLEERPERIVVSGSGNDVELLAALGVTPVAASAVSETLVGFAIETLPHEIETLWESGDSQHPAETIAATGPDLIIADTIAGSADAEEFTQLSDIAPVFGTHNEEDYVWQDGVRQLGEALDLADRAEEVIKENEAEYQRIRDEYPELDGKTITYFAFWGGEHGASVLNIPGSPSEDNFSRLGFAENPRTEEFAADNGSISNELISELDADVVLILSNTSSPEELEEFINQPMFQNLEAVQEGRTVEIDMVRKEDLSDREILVNGDNVVYQGHIGHALGGSPGPLAGPYLADALVPYFVEALEN